MPVSCCAVNCTNRFKKGSGINFYVIPVKAERRQAWVKAISRANWVPKSSDRLCGQHFVQGKPSNDPTNVDYIPTRFKDSKRRLDQRQLDPERNERRIKRDKIREELESFEDITAADSDVQVCKERTETDQLRDRILQLENKVEELEKKYKLMDTQVQELHAENFALRETISDYTIQSTCTVLENIKDNDKKVKFYTGLPTYLVFMSLFEYLQPKVQQARAGLTRVPVEHQGKGRKHILQPIEEYLAVLMRLRLGLLLEDTADRFGVSISTMGRVFTLWVNVASAQMPVIFPWPSRQQIQATTPKQFLPYPNTRIIIDCTEFYIQRPSSLNTQAETFSHYKKSQYF